MKAAVLHALGDVPRYEDFAEPTADKDEALVRMRAASLKNSDKMVADGSHYDSLRQLPAVVGLDGVGVLEDGIRVYCGAPRPPYGRWRRRPWCQGRSACRYRMGWTI
jgi:NADPH:quinone reductase-like Zn-dependent oxidoreductase